jgi:hypothetical protein
MMYERHSLVTGGLPLAALKAQADINPAARAAGNSPECSHEFAKDRSDLFHNHRPFTNWSS